MPARLFILIPFLLVAACGGTSKPASTDTVVSTPTPTGVSAPVVGTQTAYSCANDPSNTYLVYVPQSCNTQAPRRVVVFFDPHGDGALPLTKYAALAEKHGYVFVGSTTLKNGLPMDRVDLLGRELLDDLRRLFPIDSSRLILCGFSGGARSASVVGMRRADVQGIIVCSASPAQHLNKPVVGIAGMGDMNYLELREFMKTPSTNSALQELLVFNGKHEWPPSAELDAAITLLRTARPATALDAQDSITATATTTWALTAADSMRKTDCEAAFHLLQSATRLTASAQSKQVQAAFEKLKTDPCVKRAANEHQQIEAQEKNLQQEIQQNIMQQDTAWWAQHANTYFTAKQNGPEQQMRQRLQGYASLICYSYSNQALKVNNLHAAEKMINLYRIVDPENSEWAYLRALLYMQLQLPEQALNDLDRAVNIGFKDRARLQNEPAFLSLVSDPRFQTILSKIN